MKKIGIFGGSFDPVHLGHVKLAEFMIDELKLDEMLIVPAKMSPFKTTSGTTDENRLAMCRLAFDNKKYNVSSIEIDRGGKSYTYDTLCKLSEIYNDSELYLIIGSDQLLHFAEWYRYQDILKKAVLCAVSRKSEDKTQILNNYAEKNLSSYGKCVILEFNPFQISSTQIRNCASKGESLCGKVPEKVAAYIKSKGLYLNSEL